jgi:hypothetical protein
LACVMAHQYPEAEVRTRFCYLSLGHQLQIDPHTSPKVGVLLPCGLIVAGGCCCFVVFQRTNCVTSEVLGCAVDAPPPPPPPPPPHSPASQKSICSYLSPKNPRLSYNHAPHTRAGALQKDLNYRAFESNSTRVFASAPFETAA